MDSIHYNFNLPPELVAHSPAEPRDSSRLLIYSTKTNEVLFDTFAHISRYLPENSLLVLNDTRVVPARLECTKITGGTVRILFLVNEWDGVGVIRGLPDRKVTVGDTLYVNQRPCVQATSQHNEEFTFRLLISPKEFSELCQSRGSTPLPPYIHSSLTEAEARTRYQTVFADKPASVAAPTASLHFTDKVFQSLAVKNITKAFVTLHVGRGTFSPVTPEMIGAGKLHEEPVSISQESANRILAAKNQHVPIIAVGTTAVRSIESAADALLAGNAFEGSTSIFIKPPFNFRVADGLITNFHIPNTSLLMLLDAFLRSKGAKMTWRQLYELAIHERFRFYSFGDSMLIL
jgi:S-adenosylmethionine:tRNA ribosyltransferase-isomerase